MFYSERSIRRLSPSTLAPQAGSVLAAATRTTSGSSLTESTSSVSNWQFGSRRTQRERRREADSQGQDLGFYERRLRRHSTAIHFDQLSSPVTHTDTQTLPTLAENVTAYRSPNVERQSRSQTKSKLPSIVQALCKSRAMSYSACYQMVQTQSLGYTPMRTHYAFGSKSDLNTPFSRPVHASVMSHTPPARITHEYSYTRPRTLLTPRFDYKLNPYTYKLINDVDDEIEAEKKFRQPFNILRRSASTGLASTAVKWSYVIGSRENNYPTAEFLKDHNLYETMKKSLAGNTVSKQETELLENRIKALTVDKDILKDRAEKLERELIHKERQLSAGGGAGRLKELELQVSLLKTELNERKRIEQELKDKLVKRKEEREGAQSDNEMKTESTADAAPPPEEAAAQQEVAEGEAQKAEGEAQKEEAPKAEGEAHAEGGEELAKAKEEIASLNAIREKLESDMVALQQQMEEAISELNKSNAEKKPAAKKALPKK